jgi:CheY-like chemotaxis protein
MSTPGPAVTGVSGARVLLLEDEAPIRLVLARLLERDGWQVTAATTAEEALAVLDTLPGLDAAVSDFTLPGLDGLRVLEVVGARWPTAIRVLMSGQHMLGDTPRAGITFVPKPFIMADLVTQLREALAARGGGAHS